MDGDSSDEESSDGSVPTLMERDQNDSSDDSSSFSHDGDYNPFGCWDDYDSSCDSQTMSQKSCELIWDMYEDDLSDTESSPPPLMQSSGGALDDESSSSDSLSDDDKTVYECMLFPSEMKKAGRVVAIAEFPNHFDVFRREVAIPTIELATLTLNERGPKIGINTYLADTGASSHMGPGDAGMFDIEKVKSSIKVGDGKHLPTEKVGKRKGVIQQNGSDIQSR